MGIINKITNRVLGRNKDADADQVIKQAMLRRCNFEVMEERKVLSADPVVAGVTYLEGDTGTDSTPDHFEVTFEGGSDATQLTQFVISGDQDFSGDISDGDVFFDVGQQPLGAGLSHSFEFDAANSSGLQASDILGVSVSDDGLSLIVDVQNFEAGDVLAFTIDVDEIESLRTDRITSGVEFEGSTFNATFADENFFFESRDLEVDVTIDNGQLQNQTPGIFFDEFNELVAAGEDLAGSPLDLAADNDGGFENRSAAAIDVFDPVERPVAISGTVFHDEDLDCIHDGSVPEEGIPGVTIDLQRLNEQTGEFETVATTVTDENGDYEFGLELGLPPGTYQLVQTQPEGFLDVGAIAGSEGGEVLTDADGNANIIGQIEIPLGNTISTDNDFKEIQPAQLSGNVFHDEDNDGVFDPNESGIANVLIQVTRVAPKPGATSDPFALNDPIFAVTDENGHYSIDSLPPGIYEIIEINNYPPDADPLAPFLDGRDSIGNVDGVTVGQQENDRFFGVELHPGSVGTEFNFGEVLPSSISGYVSVGLPGEDKLSPDDPGFRPIEGVTIQLFDADGNFITDTLTDENGRYDFAGLAPGTYSIVQVQPGGFVDGPESLGNIDGVPTGIVGEDRFDNIVLNSGDEGVRFDFCEHDTASISGFVSINEPGEAKLSFGDPGFRPIEGVTIQLLDANGDLVSETQTDENGQYEFVGLIPGTYSVVQIQPEGFLDGPGVLGTVDGESIGTAGVNRFDNIVLGASDEGVEFNFCEHEPASIEGTVFHDRNNNGIQESDDEGIAGVAIQLFDADDNLIQETVTDANGNYSFENLIPGDYILRQTQPQQFADGIDTVGTVDGISNGGIVNNDEFVNITLSGGDRGVDYDFGEILLAEISGFVHVNNDGDCATTVDPTENPIPGVTLELLNGDGEVIATTVTGPDGSYSFAGLIPGTYSVRQIQPESFFDGDVSIGEGGGSASVNLIEGIVIESGQQLTQHNFCEVEGASIHGQVFQDGPAFVSEDGSLPENFRDLRDSIFQESEDTPIAGVRVELFFFVDPTAGPEGEIAPRPVTLGEVIPDTYDYLGTDDPDTPLFAITDENGEYWFDGLPAGNYIVLEVQPEGFEDANDVPGTTTGFAFNSESEATTAIAPLTSTFSETELQDAVIGITVNAGGSSLQNNFTEVLVTIPDPPPPTPEDPEDPITPETPQDPIPFGNPITPRPGVAGQPGLQGSELFDQIVLSNRGLFQTRAETENNPYTWHLSVINGGLPRAENGDGNDQSAWQQVSFAESGDWFRFDMAQGTWTFTEMSEDHEISKKIESYVFGTIDGTPLAGDFDGDGIDEVAMFNDGYWLIDINHNGRWDENDLMARLGNAEDRPVVGDWDGDGKDDIGIFGPMWERDQEAIDFDPGLPNPDNDIISKPKNVPPSDRDATNGARVMKLTSYGQKRADVVDHVFGTDDGGITPVTGDWNGNGIRSIGRFVDGFWEVDVNGDGRFDARDASFVFGQAGDIPLVGDFNGDGIEEIAIYRSGTWLIDTNGNRELDATDKTFELGGDNDLPVVGDFNGDGIDEPGLYTPHTRTDLQL